jgi:hypothetical protein
MPLKILRVFHSWNWKINVLFIISHSVLFRIGSVSDETCSENRNTQYMFSNFLFRKSFLNVILWKNIVEPDRSQMTVWRMHIACWLTLATDTHSEYVIRIAFPLQQWLHEGSPLLRYTYTASLVCFYVGLSESHQTMVTNSLPQLHHHHCTWYTFGSMSSGLTCSAVLCELSYVSENTVQCMSEYTSYVGWSHIG